MTSILSWYTLLFIILFAITGFIVFMTILERTNGLFVLSGILIVLTFISYRTADKNSEKYFNNIKYLIETNQVISIIKEPTEEGFNFYIRTNKEIYEVTGEIFYELKDTNIKED